MLSKQILRRVREKMTISFKNFWSLNTDEAVVTGILRNYFKKKAEVFMPLNAQLKHIDLVVVNLKTSKLSKIQIKGSKAYQPTKKETLLFKNGSGGWFFPKEEVIRDCTADYMIFLVYVIVEDPELGRMRIENHTITIKPSELYKICQEKKILHKNYSFYIWIDPKRKKAFEHRDKKQKGIIELDKYLDEKGFEQILADLGL